MPAVLLALLGAILSVMAFPPIGPGLLIVPGVAAYLLAIRKSSDSRHGLLVGAVYGLTFFGGLMWWLSELELIALVLVPVQAVFHAVYGMWLARHNKRSPGEWLVLAVGGWAAMELVRYRFPVGGLEWGAAGYALSDIPVTRAPAAVVGTTGLTVSIVLVAAATALAITTRMSRRLVALALILLGLVLFVLTQTLAQGHVDSEPVEIAIVQGSTPCPFEHCPPNERLRTYEQHLELTRTIAPGSADLVVWSEGSTGSTNADPVLNQEVREAIGAEARRIGADFLVGGDRIISDAEWINANVFFNSEGELIGEYRKQHPVPFGEYIPARPLFEWIPALDRVPRDMIPGEGPVIFDTSGYALGSVISFEGGFSRYGLETRRTGASILVVATNEGSYGMAPTSDQFIGMTRMRAVELGVPVIHAAVTGKSTIIDRSGDFDEMTALGTREILTGTVGESHRTLYSHTGDVLMYLAVIGAGLVWLRHRSLVSSGSRSTEEE